MALLTSPVSEYLTCPDPPMMEPYMASMNIPVETRMSKAMDPVVILPVPE